MAASRTLGNGADPGAAEGGSSPPAPWNSIELTKKEKRWKEEERRRDGLKEEVR